MRTIVIGNTTPNTYMRPFVGTRAQITAANLPNGTLAIVTDEAENSIDLTVVYPVGSIYMNATSDTNPATLFGIGTWSLIDSKFLYGTNSLLSDLGDTGGSTTATLVQNNLPASLTGLTISAMTGSTSTESTDHTHSVNVTIGSIIDKNGKTTLTFVHEHQINMQANALWTQWSLPGEYSGQALDTNAVSNSNKARCMAEGTDIFHRHTTSTTVGNQSEHSTHSHTVDVDSQIVNLTNVGSGTAFSILPTYRKVAMWYRVQ